MDVLDLSLGEKRSRRKANMPQRRHGLDHSIRTDGIHDEADQNETPQNGNGDFQSNAPVESGTEVILPEEEKDFCEPELYGSGEKVALEIPRTYTPIRSQCSTPNDSDDKESVGRSFNGSNPSSPTELIKKKILAHSSQSALSYHVNTNNNSNHSVSLTRFPQLPSNAVPNLPSASSDLSAFQERFGLPSSSPQSLMRPNMKSSPRLRYTNYDVQPIDTPGIPERTKKQNRWAFNVWREWARKRNIASGPSSGNLGKVPLDVGKATEGELDYWLSKFVQEIRRKDGNPYPPHTLMQIVMGIQRYLRQQAGRPSICILDRSNPIYGRFRSVLDIRIKELTTEGVTASHKGGRRSSLPATGGTGSHHSSYTGSGGNYPEQSVLWSAGIIGNDTALGLLNAVFYHNTVTFGIRNIDDHWNLKMSHFVLGNRGQQSQAYIEFAPSSDPVYANRSMTKDRRVYAEPENPRCVVKIFQKYMSLVPTDGPFYRHPQEPTVVDRSIRFSDQWVGKNRLRAMIKHVFDSTRLDGKERSQPSNHSTSNSTKYPANQYNPPPNETPGVAPTVYDRLAQVMMQLSYMRSSPQITALTNPQSSPLNPSTPSPKPESASYSSSPPPPGAHIAHGAKEIVLKREYSPDSLLGVSQPKKLKTSYEAEKSTERVKSEKEGDDVTDNVRVTSSCEKHIEENMLEITVPRNIEMVTVVKGGKRITIQLD